MKILPRLFFFFFFFLIKKKKKKIIIKKINIKQEIDNNIYSIE